MATLRPSAGTFVRTNPARPVAGAGRGAPKRSRATAALLGLARRRWGTLLTVAGVSGFSAAIGWNVLAHQKARHPAPLFGTERAALVTEPVRRPDLASAPLPVPKPESVAAPEAAPAKTAKPAAGDPIGALIRANTAQPSADPRPDPTRVVAAQKALAKLGYGPLKPDGVAGATTRQALERFERDQNIPVTGSLGTRTTRQLASKAGLPID
jgi:hypothetical protein